MVKPWCICGHPSWESMVKMNMFKSQSVMTMHQHSSIQLLTMTQNNICISIFTSGNLVSTQLTCITYWYVLISYEKKRRHFMTSLDTFGSSWQPSFADDAHLYPPQVVSLRRRTHSPRPIGHPRGRSAWWWWDPHGFNGHIGSHHPPQICSQSKVSGI